MRDSFGPRQRVCGETVSCGVLTTGRPVRNWAWIPCRLPLPGLEVLYLSINSGICPARMGRYFTRPTNPV